MKKLLATAALATLIALPAMAQTPSKPRLSKQTTNHQTQVVPFGRSEGRAHSTNAANDVYDHAGRYVGSDPDARIRLDIQREEGGTTD